MRGCQRVPSVLSRFFPVSNFNRFKGRTLLWEQGVAGSSPAAPTTLNEEESTAYVTN